MTQLYSIRTTTTPGEWTVKKFDTDFNCTAEYTITKSTCSGPDGHRPKCKHREMLRVFLEKGQINTGSFFDWDTRKFHKPLVNPGPNPGGDGVDDLRMFNLKPSASPILGLSDEDQMAQKLSTAHESEASALVKVSDMGLTRDLMEAKSVMAKRQPLTAAAHTSQAAVKAPPAKDEVQRPKAGGAPPFTLLKVKL